jgi:hypothetical protein
MNCLKLTVTRYTEPVRLTVGMVCSVGTIGGLMSSDKKYLFSKDGFLIYPHLGYILLSTEGEIIADNEGASLIGK